MKTKIYARESVAFDEVLTVRDSDGAPIDITGWSFSADLMRQAGTPDIELGAVSAGSEGFSVVDGPNGSLGMRIDQATLEGVGDTTGNFTLFGDLLATVGGETRFVSDLRLNVTTAGEDFAGSTYSIVLTAVAAAVTAEIQALVDQAAASAAEAAASVRFTAQYNPPLADEVVTNAVRRRFEILTSDDPPPITGGGTVTIGGTTSMSLFLTHEPDLFERTKEPLAMRLTATVASITSQPRWWLPITLANLASAGLVASDGSPPAFSARVAFQLATLLNQTITGDNSANGQFWVILRYAGAGASLAGPNNPGTDVVFAQNANLPSASLGIGSADPIWAGSTRTSTLTADEKVIRRMDVPLYATYSGQALTGVILLFAGQTTAAGATGYSIGRLALVPGATIDADEAFFNTPEDNVSQTFLRNLPPAVQDILNSAEALADEVRSANIPQTKRQTKRSFDLLGVTDALPGYQLAFRNTATGEVPLGITDEGLVHLVPAADSLAAGWVNYDVARLCRPEAQLGDDFGTMFAGETDVVVGRDADRTLGLINGYTAPYLIRRDIASANWIGDSSTGYIEMHLANGQSLSVGGLDTGSTGEEIYNTVPPAPQHGLMFNTGTRGVGNAVLDPATLTELVPAVEEYDSVAGQGETQGSGLVSYLHRDDLRRNLPLGTYLFHASGIGGANIATLDKAGGGKAYPNGIAAVNKGISLAAKYGKEIRLPFVHWTQGNQDANEAQSRAAHKAALIQLATDYQTDLAAILPVTNPDVILLTDQLRAGYVLSTTSYSEIAVAQWEAAVDEPTLIRMIGPMYQYRSEGGTHLPDDQYALHGELRASVARRIDRDGEDWYPVHITDVTIDGSSLVVDLYAPSGQILIDRHTLVPALNLGFEYTDATSTATIVSGAVIEQTGDAQLTIPLTAVPSGATKRLQYAYKILGGNIRDASAEPSYQVPGAMLWHWMVTQDFVI